MYTLDKYGENICECPFCGQDVRVSGDFKEQIPGNWSVAFVCENPECGFIICHSKPRAGISHKKYLVTMIRRFNERVCFDCAE